MRIFLFVIFLGIIQFAHAQSYPQDYFRSPLDIPILLSGTFGELRGNHFHSGLDLKTQGVEGLPVYAAADGHVVRIKISAYGYGNALYIAHPNGYTTVYAHLQKLTSEMAEWVKAQQYAQKSFEVDLFPPASKFKVTQGQEVAKSGNSGGSGGPHLHFEIRDTKSEKPINPALFGFDIADTSKPVVQQVYVQHMATAKQTEVKLINEGNGIYTGAFEAGGSFGLIIKTFDQQNLSDNKNGIFEIEQYVNDTLNYHFRIEKFHFDETRYINAHMDFARYINLKQLTHKCYVEPGNYLSVYSSKKNRGTINIREAEEKNIKLVIKDSWGNTSEVRLKARGYSPETAEPDTSLLDFTITNTIKSEGLEVIIPAKTMYKNQPLKLQRANNCLDCESVIYKVGDATIPAHNRFTIRIHKNQLRNTDRVVWAITNGNENGKTSGLTSAWEGDWLLAKPRAFGYFVVMQDTVAPIMKVQDFANGRVVKPGHKLYITATDNLSGITEYKAMIDGKWVLLERDAKKNLWWHDFEKNLEAGSHTLTIIMSDEVGNKTSFQAVFTYHP